MIKRYFSFLLQNIQAKKQNRILAVVLKSNSIYIKIYNT